jgi:hypothetical protein
MTMNAVDGALLWLRAMIARVVHVVRLLTTPERLLVGTLCLCTVVAGVALLLNPDLGSLAILGSAVLVTVGLVPPVLADAVILRENLKRAGVAMIRTNAAKPTGAPRVAEVSCRHGDPHRFVYGPTGWEAAGPAVERRPIPEEAPAP